MSRKPHQVVNLPGATKLPAPTQAHAVFSDLNTVNQGSPQSAENLSESSDSVGAMVPRPFRKQRTPPLLVPTEQESTAPHLPYVIQLYQRGHS